LSRKLAPGTKDLNVRRGGTGVRLKEWGEWTSCSLPLAELTAAREIVRWIQPRGKEAEPRGKATSEDRWQGRTKHIVERLGSAPPFGERSGGDLRIDHEHLTTAWPLLRAAMQGAPHCSHLADIDVLVASGADEEL
jgi:hypothetical protein